MKTFVSPFTASCLSIISIAGIIFLSIIGYLFDNGFEGLTESTTDPVDPKAAANVCFTAAGIYGGLFIVMSCQNWAHSRNLRNEITL